MTANIYFVLGISIANHQTLASQTEENHFSCDIYFHDFHHIDNSDNYDEHSKILDSHSCSPTN